MHNVATVHGAYNVYAGRTPVGPLDPTKTQLTMLISLSRRSCRYAWMTGHTRPYNHLTMSHCSALAMDLHHGFLHCLGIFLTPYQLPLCSLCILSDNVHVAVLSLESQDQDFHFGPRKPLPLSLDYELIHAVALAIRKNLTHISVLASMHAAQRHT
ncbi:hypothetical protein B0H34DRAFT_387404 [Crassisporium funariophilum]|nr:hypothetical protein B0H34DRAFT_387404 [Crassisporium funariophilum]